MPVSGTWAAQYVVGAASIITGSSSGRVLLERANHFEQYLKN